jgi:hypothetical protein
MKPGMRSRCDPIHYQATLSALAKCGCGLIGPSRDAAVLRRLYADYASVAARPYARATWELMLRAEQRPVEQGGAEHQFIRICECNGERKDASDIELDDASDTHWGKHLQIKPRILTTIDDKASLRVKGGALVVCDGSETLVYEAGARKPQAIVMTGWSGTGND